VKPQFSGYFAASSDTRLSHEMGGETGNAGPAVVAVSPEIWTLMGKPANVRTAVRQEFNVR
jgi:hypothetical protein